MEWMLILQVVTLGLQLFSLWKQYQILGTLRGPKPKVHYGCGHHWELASATPREIWAARENRVQILYRYQCTGCGRKEWR